MEHEVLGDAISDEYRIALPKWNSDTDAGTDISDGEEGKGALQWTPPYKVWQIPSHRSSHADTARTKQVFGDSLVQIVFVFAHGLVVLLHF